MSGNRRAREIDGGYGWVAVAAAFVVHFVGFGIIYSFTVFFPEILAEFDSGRGPTSWIVSIAAALMLGSGGITGRLADRWGPGRMVAGGGLLVGLGLLLSSIATSVWQVYGSYGLLLGLGVGCAFVPSIATVGQWFDRRRGFAIGVAVAGTGMGSLVLAPLSSALIDAIGWRAAIRAVGAIGAVSLLFAGAVLRARLEPDPLGGAVATARGNPVFRLLYGSSLVASYGYWVPFVHIVPYAEDRGLSTASAALLVSIIGLANTGGRIAMGAIADRVGRRRIMQASGVAMAIALFVWPLARSWASLAAFGAFYGLFAGAFIALLPALAGDYFGVQRLAGVTGLLFTGAAAGTLVGAPATGLLFDAQGSYTPGIVIAGAAMAAGAAMLLRLPAPPAANSTPR